VLELLNSYKEQIRIRRDKYGRGIEGSGGSLDLKRPMYQSQCSKLRPTLRSGWKSLLDVEMSCGIVSYLDRDQVDILLEEAD
jgi:hypothetical protein